MLSGKNQTTRNLIIAVLCLTLFITLMEFTPISNQIQDVPSNIGLSPIILPESANPDSFVSIWDTTRTSSGSSSTDQVKLPLINGGIYNFFVDWGDGNNDTITTWNQLEATHTYNSSGVHTVNITGIIIGWGFNDIGDKLKLLEILQWGFLRLGNDGNYFKGCSNLLISATDSLNLTGTTNLGNAFANCINLGTSGNFDSWDVSGVTNMGKKAQR